MRDEFKVPMSRPAVDKKEEESILKVLRSGWLSEGKKTQEFENNLSDYLDSKVVVVNNGSSALMCALLAHGLKPGDKVIVPAFTFIATSSVPKILGAKIIPVDIDPNTLNIHPETVIKLVKKHEVKAVIAVDVGGLPVDIDELSDLSKRYHFTLIEDAAEALGSEYKNQKVGSFAHTTIFSFHIAKQITTIEGGCIATTDKQVFKKIKQIKNHGREETGIYNHLSIGSNFRTTDLQSAMGIMQLKKIESFIARRIKIANEYRHKIKFDFQDIPKYATRHTFMLFFALAKNETLRGKYLKHLRGQGIDARMPWIPINMQPCNPEIRTKCDVAENVYRKAFTLPIYNSMTDEEIKLVIESCQNVR